VRLAGLGQSEICKRKSKIGGRLAIGIERISDDLGVLAPRDRVAPEEAGDAGSAGRRRAVATEYPVQIEPLEGDVARAGGGDVGEGLLRGRVGVAGSLRGDFGKLAPRYIVAWAVV